MHHKILDPHQHDICCKKIRYHSCLNTYMLWCTGEAGKVVVPVVKGRHVIPTGNQIPNTPLLAMAAPRPSAEPAGTVQCYPHGEPDPQHSSPCHGGTQAQYRAGRYSTVLSSLGTRSPTLLSSPWRPSTEPAGTGGILMDGWTIKDGIGFA